MNQIDQITVTCGLCEAARGRWPIAVYMRGVHPSHRLGWWQFDQTAQLGGDPIVNGLRAGYDSLSPDRVVSHGQMFYKDKEIVSEGAVLICSKCQKPWEIAASTASGLMENLANRGIDRVSLQDLQRQQAARGYSDHLRPQLHSTCRAGHARVSNLGVNADPK